MRNSYRLTWMLSGVAAAMVGACDGQVQPLGEVPALDGSVTLPSGNPDASPTPPDANPTPVVTTPEAGPDPLGDGGPPESTGDAGVYALPPECGGDGGAFATATAASLSAQIVGTWINCGQSSIFTAIGETQNGAGIVFRADYTWQALGGSGANLYYLTAVGDFGTWSTYPSTSGPEEYLSIQSASSGTDLLPQFTSDGRALLVTEPGGELPVTLAKAVGTP